MPLNKESQRLLLLLLFADLTKLKRSDKFHLILNAVVGVKLFSFVNFIFFVEKNL